MKVFILAAGSQTRFPDNYTPKQLLVVNNETILDRQLRQLKEYNLVPTVITKNESIKQAAPVWFDPKENKTVIDSFISAMSEWSDGRVIYLLGDVFYSKALFKEIIESSLDLKFWMSGSEIFALSFNNNKFLKIADAVKTVKRSSIEQKLWHLYRALNKAKLHKHVIHNNEMTGEMVVDYTFDIDSLIQYQDVCRYVEILKETCEV